MSLLMKSSISNELRLDFAKFKRPRSNRIFILMTAVAAIYSQFTASLGPRKLTATMSYIKTPDLISGGMNRNVILLGINFDGSVGSISDAFDPIRQRRKFIQSCPNLESLKDETRELGYMMDMTLPSTLSTLFVHLTLNAIQRVTFAYSRTHPNSFAIRSFVNRNW